jgi:hypothetical protein
MGGQANLHKEPAMADDRGDSAPLNGRLMTLRIIWLALLLGEILPMRSSHSTGGER